jgi:hypothetical protein
MQITKDVIQNSIRETEREIYRLEGTLRALQAVLKELEKPEPIQPEVKEPK